jgi:hypothetical protein
MSDVKVHEEVHGISTAIEDQAHVIAGYGETTKREGAKTKEVHNVSLLLYKSFVQLKSDIYN